MELRITNYEWEEFYEKLTKPTVKTQPLTDN